MGGYPQHLPTTPGSRPDNTSGLLPEMRVDVERRGECTASTERVHNLDVEVKPRYTPIQATHCGSVRSSGPVPDSQEAYLQIGEVAERTGVTQRTLRFYEEKGLFLP